jgi:hypothetical protein
MKIVKIILSILIGIIILIILAGIYKFNYLANQPSYDVDGNKILTNLESENNSYTNKKRILDEYICVGEFCDGSGSYDDYLEQGNSFVLPMFSKGGDIGCDMKLVNVPHYTEPKIPGILNEVYKKLFSLQPYTEILADGLENPVGLYPYIHFEKATLDNGLAKVYLTGSLRGPGHCSLPILRKQITELPFQFDSVQFVEVYVNNTLYDWCEMDLSDGEGSCPENPDLWIDSR